MAGIPVSVLNNAFRVLGLSADAPQQAVEHAARRMRIWPDPTRIAPTPWDLPWLGPLRRGRLEIEQAMARLAEPQTRLRERALWFLSACPVREPTEAALGELLAAAEQAVDPAAGHDAALAALLVAAQLDPGITAEAHWSRIISLTRQWGHGEALMRRLAAIEQEAEFEKRAHDPEIAAAANAFAVLAGIVLQEAAAAAADADNATDWVRIARLLEPIDRSAAGRIFDGVEELLESRCRILVADLQNGIRREGEPGRYYRAENLAFAESAQATFNQTILAVFTELEKLGPAHASRVERCGPSIAHAAALLAESLRWAGEFVRARDTLLRAVPLAEGTRLGAAMRQHLETIEAELATEQRAVAMAQEIGLIHSGAAFQAHSSTVIMSPAVDFARSRSDTEDFDETTIYVQPQDYQFSSTPTPRQPQQPQQTFPQTLACIVLIFLLLGAIRACVSMESRSSSMPGLPPSYIPQRLRSLTPPASDRPVWLDESSTPTAAPTPPPPREPPRPEVRANDPSPATHAPPRETRRPVRDVLLDDFMRFDRPSDPPPRQPENRDR